ncbi:MAG TPA: winged helix-turn-helix transcriptional regulator [Firmicutes bacterium]|nr:winged helix-turn-helix transcriptional regulator [Bacillota bacterium]
MRTKAVLKAIADDTRLNLVKLLLKHSYCVGALARRLGLTEAAVSQHLKVLREVGLLHGEKRGYFRHYEVNREKLRMLAAELQELAAVQREAGPSEEGGCRLQKQGRGATHKSQKEWVQEACCACHGVRAKRKESERDEHHKCEES